jgi:hypothetical protein
MKIQDILKGLGAKASEAKRLTGLNSRHFAFRNWHTTVMQLLKELPSSYVSQVNDFKALTFEDTGFKRGRKFLSSSDNTRFLQDLEASGNIINEIIKASRTKDASASGPAEKPAGKKKKS